MGFNIEMIEPLPERQVTDEEIQDVTCVICVDIVQRPQQCDQCNNVFCKECINDWTKKQKTCPFKCKPGNDEIRFQKFQGPKKEIYDKIKIRCQVKCKNYFHVADLEQHEILCQLQKCQNHEQCKGFEIFLFKGISCCSYSCYKSIKKDKPLGAQQAMKVLFNYDTCSNNYRKIDKQTCSYTYNNNKIFSTIVSEVQLFGGLHNIKVKIKNGGGNLKLGFTTSTDFDLKNKSFSDYDHGFGWYNKGQLRNGSDFYGKLYGISLFDSKSKKDFEVNCIINMNKGTIQFDIDGKEYGQAYQSEELKNNPIYFAFAAGSTIDSINITNQ